MIIYILIKENMNALILFYNNGSYDQIKYICKDTPENNKKMKDIVEYISNNDYSEDCSIYMKSVLLNEQFTMKGFDIPLEEILINMCGWNYNEVYDKVISILDK